MNTLSHNLSFCRLLPLLAVGVLVSACTNPQQEDPQAAVRATLALDRHSNPAEMTQIQDLRVSDAQPNPQAAFFTRGCLSSGNPQPKIETDPNLAVGQIFNIERVTERRAVILKLNTVLTIDSVTPPQISSHGLVSATGTQIRSSILNSSLVKKTCLFSTSENFEKCQMGFDFTASFKESERKAMNPVQDCQEKLELDKQGNPVLQTTERAAGSYSLSDGTKLNALITTTQKQMVVTCGDNIQSEYHTLKVITSNDIVSDEATHCGGAIVFTQKTVRTLDGALQTRRTDRVLMAPKAPL